jgi:metallo-beta-lactamase class B
MKRLAKRSASTMAVILAAMILASGAVAQRGDFSAQSREPFKIFDNLYYVGVDFVSAYLVPTSDGLIVIDALFADSADQLLENVRTLGFDPQDIRYVFVSHGHGDHAGGAPRIQEVTGATVGMAVADWEMTGETPDLMLTDGMEITLGDTTFTFFNTPGHTLGVTSMRFPVRDDGETHTAFMFGGMGTNFSGVPQAEMFLESVRRVRGFDGIEVSITNHEGAGQIFARADRLRSRGPSDPHPFVDPEAFDAWMAGLEESAETKLATERAATN